jgi:hypothetical protein
MFQPLFEGPGQNQTEQQDEKGDPDFDEGVDGQNFLNDPASQLSGEGGEGVGIQVFFEHGDGFPGRWKMKDETTGPASKPIDAAAEFPARRTPPR